MSDEKFFSQVKSTMEHYAPEAPAEVYSGMRKKLWWSGFTKLSVTRFNIWYIILFLGAGGGALAYNNTCKAPANTAASHNIAPVVQPAAEKPAVVETEPVKTEKTIAPAKVETATALPAASEPVKKSSSVSKKAKTTEAETPKAETAETSVAVPAESVEASSETPASDSAKEETPKKKRKKLTLDIFTDTSKDSSEGEN